MYLSFYRLQLKPFQNSPDPNFYWLGETHQEALAIFKYGILKMPGILLLTGDVGTGKTTLVNVLIKNLGDTFTVVKIPDPDLEELDFVNSLSDKLGFKEKFARKNDFYNKFISYLGALSHDGKKILLVVDECQRLGSSLLGEISTLASLEKGKKKSLSVLLIGQNVFNDMLLKTPCSALNELISINYSIGPLNLSETGKLIQHRLRVAGAKKEIFTPDAITKIYQFSAGIPCRINIICDHVLLIGFVKGAETVNAELVTKCIDDLCPRGYSKELKSPPLDSLADEDFGHVKKIPPASPGKKSMNRAGKLLAMIFLLAIPVFLTIFIIDKLISHDSGDREIETPSPGTVLDQRATQPEDTPESSPRPEKSMPEQDSAELSVAGALANGDEQAVSGIMQEAKSDSTMPPVMKSSWKDGLPDLSAMNGDIDGKQQTNMPAVLPFARNQQELAGDSDRIPGQMSSDSAEVLPSTTGADLPGQARDETDIVQQNGGGAAGTAPVEPEKSSIGNPPEGPVSQETSLEDEDLTFKENEVKNPPGIVVEEDGGNDLSSSEKQSDGAEEIEEARERAQENVDPGAIIDWIIKNRSK